MRPVILLDYKYHPMYAKNTIHTIIFALCIIFYFATPKESIQVYSQQVLWSKSTQATSTWELRTPTKAKAMESKLHTPVPDVKQADTKKPQEKRTSWNDCNTECKVKKLTESGIHTTIAKSLVYTCKDTAKDPVRCIKIGASIVGAESGGWKNCYKSGCFWILAWGTSYKDLEHGVEDWVKRYNKHWYNQTTPNSFYNNKIWEKPKTRYCMSETDSNIKGYCPHWHKNAWAMFNKVSIFLN